MNKKIKNYEEYLNQNGLNNYLKESLLDKLKGSTYDEVINKLSVDDLLLYSIIDNDENGIKYALDNGANENLYNKLYKLNIGYLLSNDNNIIKDIYYNRKLLLRIKNYESLKKLLPNNMEIIKNPIIYNDLSNISNLFVLFNFNKDIEDKEFVGFFSINVDQKINYARWSNDEKIEDVWKLFK